MMIDTMLATWVHGSDVGKLVRVLRCRNQLGAETDAQLRLRTSAGTIVPVEIHAEPALDDAGLQAVTIVDLRPRMAEQQVRQRHEEERYRSALREQSARVTEFRQAHRGELPDEQETSLRRLELLTQQRESLAQQITAKEDRLLSISSHGSESSEAEVLIGDPLRVPGMLDDAEVLATYEASFDGDVRGLTRWRTHVLRLR